MRTQSKLPNPQYLMNEMLVNKAADNIRILSAAMVERANSGHPGGSMGGADFLNILYSEFLRFDPSDPVWFFRDRFFLDPGHLSPMIYSTLALMGLYTIDDLKEFRQWGSCTSGHPEKDPGRGIENTSGPLGQGHGMAVGAAIAERFIRARFGEWTEHTIYTYISDGGIQEEISQGAGRLAGHLGLSNLVMFYDANEIQLSTRVDEVTGENTAMKYEAWGWKVLTINGNDQYQIRKALKEALAEKKRPTLIIGKTVMAKGAVDENHDPFEEKVSTHGQPLSQAGASFGNTVRNLGGDPASPFAVFEDVKDYYAECRERKIREVAERKAAVEKWGKDHPQEAEQLRRFLSLEVPSLKEEELDLKKDQPTRGTSGAMLAYYAKRVDNMIVMSADLSNSDKTEGFIKGGKKPITREDFSGGFLHAGVSELTMAALANGIALHGGVHVACGTFFVFSDFMKPAIRLAALMELPVKYIWTHDAFRVGEDGPTHQPVEQEMQIRLLEQVKNHSGRNSMLVLRPADARETVEAWQLAMKNHDSPTGLVLSRQSVKDLPGLKGKSRIEEAKECSKGAYIVRQPAGKPDVVLIGNGSEVSTLFEAMEMLIDKEKLDVQLVSAISEGLFMLQDEAYRKKVIPPGVPAFGLTAGLPVTLARLVGPKGRVFGLDHFGYSAPAKVLDEKFGFTAENIFREVTRYLGDYNAG